MAGRLRGCRWTCLFCTLKETAPFEPAHCVCPKGTTESRPSFLPRLCEQRGGAQKGISGFLCRTSKPRQPRIKSAPTAPHQIRPDSPASNPPRQPRIKSAPTAPHQIRPDSPASNPPRQPRIKSAPTAPHQIRPDSPASNPPRQPRIKSAPTAPHQIRPDSPASNPPRQPRIKSAPTAPHQIRPAPGTADNRVVIHPQFTH